MVESWIYKLAHWRQDRLAFRNPRVNSDTEYHQRILSMSGGTAATACNRDLAAATACNRDLAAATACSRDLAAATACSRDLAAE